MVCEPTAVVGDPTVALGILRSGDGLAFLPSLYGEPRVAMGDFVRALPDFERPQVEVFACFPPRRPGARRAGLHRPAETARGAGLPRVAD